MDHQALDEGAVVVARQPVILVAVPISLGNDLTLRVQPGVAEIADDDLRAAYGETVKSVRQFIPKLR